jgi:hypothetical protein
VLTLREVIITSTTTTQVAPKSNMKRGEYLSGAKLRGENASAKNESI